MIKTIDAALFCQMVISAANKLNDNKTAVDALNVFPVPDGDTGTNMSLTFLSAAREVEGNAYDTIGQAAQAVAKATLRGARGNSGVILSQIFRGISKSLQDKTVATAADFAAALQNGSDTAYRAVMKPTEGTVLTVIRKSAAAAVEYTGDSIDELFAAVIARGNRTLAKTQDMLPQLKQAGVVDAGGQGLMYILEGFVPPLAGGIFALRRPSTQAEQQSSAAQQSVKAEEIKFAYCTEFIINKYDASASAEPMRNLISQKGDCMLVIEDDDVVKVHIHTNHPGFVLEQAVKLGEMVNIKIDNMKHQHHSLIEPSQTEEPLEKGEPIDLGIIAVAAGEGLGAHFKELGVHRVIEGGQTMNPSTEDFLAAIEALNAKQVIILPNNKNIILAAEQVKVLTQTPVAVIPTKSIPQGIAAMLTFAPTAAFDDTVAAMNDALDTVQSASVTHAVRDTVLADQEIHEGNYLGMAGSQIRAVGDSLPDTTMELLSTMCDEDTEYITVFYGAETSAEDAAKLQEAIEEAYPDSEVFVYDGGQPVYFYIISVE